MDPLLKSRLSDLDSDKDGNYAQPNDFFQWSINNARSRLADKPEEMSPHILVGRIILMNFVAIHTSTFTIVNTIFDLVSSDHSLRYLEQLREEAASVLAEDHGAWTKNGVSKMYKIDSAIRESLRLRSFFSVETVRRVVVKGGITTPDGLYLPYGSDVTIPTYGIHHDANNYTDPAKFDAFRFVKQRDMIGAAAAEECGGEGDSSHIKKANLGMVNTSAEYQSFGHGRSACPGRFFAAIELKLLLAYMVLNYDIELLKDRPEGKWIGLTSLPPMKATLKVRRRMVVEK
jgi:cytochrome P450